jgi:O-antigen ligase/tetratricopeptide (TPR) repeat protein
VQELPATKPAVAPPAPRTALPRQIVLAGATALIVARPLVLGEDPGLLDRPLSQPSGMVLSFLWLLLAVGWAIWRMRSQEGTWRASAVDIALAVVVALVFLSANVAAAYKHPAWLIAWEWLILLVAFCLVRQLAATPDDRRGLLAVLLATGVTLSVLALYQFAFVLPANRELAADPAKLHRELQRQFGVFLEPDSPQEAFWRDRLFMNYVFATYAHPNAFAGFLALLVPAGVGWAIVAWRRYAGTWWPLAVSACAGLLAVALALTQSRGAIGATLLVGAAVAAVRWRHRWLGNRRRLVAVAAALAVLTVVGVAAVGSSGKLTHLARESMAKRVEYWAGTWRMIHDPTHRGYFWLGVGPGNFGRLYPRYMNEDALEKIQDPHNFALEAWVTCGVFALIALLAALGLFFWRTRSAWTAPPSEPADDAGPPGPPRWEFYVGGMVGLVLAFVLRVSDMTPDQIIVEGALSGVGSLLWFGAFALFESIPWPGPTQILAIVAGVAALLLNLCVSGGMFYPSVAQPLGIMAALALAPVASVWSARHWLALALPLPVAAVAAWFYFSTALLPVMRANAYLSDAKAREEIWFDHFYPDWHRAMASPAGASEKQAATLRVSGFLHGHAPEDHGKSILGEIPRPEDSDPSDREKKRGLLQRAADSDPSDSYALVHLAYWYSAEWRLYEDLYATTPDAAAGFVGRRDDAVKAALENAKKAWQIDPDNLEAYAVVYPIYQISARLESRDAQRRRTDDEQAKILLRMMVDRDPQDAPLRYALAEVLFRLGDNPEAREHARRALRRYELLRVRGVQALTDGQRTQLGKWLGIPPPG